jgi:hypothetical protein
MKAEGGRMKEKLLKMNRSGLNSMPFILHPSAFILNEDPEVYAKRWIRGK